MKKDDIVSIENDDQNKKEKPKMRISLKDIIKKPNFIQEKKNSKIEKISKEFLSEISNRYESIHHPKSREIVLKEIIIFILSTIILVVNLFPNIQISFSFILINTENSLG